MCVRIEGADNISNVFSIFHDGVICHHQLKDNSLYLEVEIQYLAERINSQFTKFKVILQRTDKIKFKTWPNDQNAEPEIIFNVDQIFSPKIEILNSKVLEDNEIQIICNQDSADLNYCGGELYFTSEAAIIRDENNKEYSLNELELLCKEYWDEWEKGNKA